MCICGVVIIMSSIRRWSMFSNCYISSSTMMWGTLCFLETWVHYVAPIWLFTQAFLVRGSHRCVPSRSVPSASIFSFCQSPHEPSMPLNGREFVGAGLASFGKSKTVWCKGTPVGVLGGVSKNHCVRAFIIASVDGLAVPWSWTSSIISTT